MTSIRYWAAAFTVLAAFSNPVNANLILNGDFEAGDATPNDFPGATSWDLIENAFTSASDGPGSAPVSRTAGGTQSLKMFGPFSGPFSGASGVFQTVDIIAGRTYELEAWVQNWERDPFRNFGILQLGFCENLLSDAGCGIGNPTTSSVTEISLDSELNPFGADVTLPIQDGAEATDWSKLSLSAVAPASAKLATVYLLHLNTDFNPGSLYWDDISLHAVPEPTSLALMSLGLAGVGFSRRKTR